MKNYTYQIGGSLQKNAPCYVTRQADIQLYNALKKGEFCYVLNSRQMGKSSLLVQTRHRLQQEGFKCVGIDMTRIGSENISPLQWYKGIVTELWRGFNLLGKFNLKTWWREEEEISLVQKLSNFIEDVLLVKFARENLVIFIDEIDSILSLDFSADDLFAFIRFCYNQRAINPAYNRISFAIFGVATPADLIADKKRTPFNIGTAIELEGFKLEEARSLATGLEEKIENSEAVLREILAWTGGQPFLTQKLCQLMLNLVSEKGDKEAIALPPGTESFWVETAVKTKIIDKWESLDEPEHLRTIRDRIQSHPERAGRLLGIYQQILQNIEVISDDSREQTELILSGLVAKKRGKLKVKNMIYQEVFNLEWVEKELTSLRPYSQTFDAWIASRQKDESRLLRGKALKDAQIWAMGKSLSDLDYQFIAASVQLDRKEVQLSLEAARTKEVEARLAEERKRLIQEKKTAKLQQFLLATLTITLLVISGLGIATFKQYNKALRNENKARLNEIKALISASEGSFNSQQRLDALIQAIKARKKLQEYNDKDRSRSELETEVKLALEKVIYTISEYDRISDRGSREIQIAIGYDGEQIATVSDETKIKLWQRNGKLLPAVLEHPSAVWNVAFSPDGRFIASATAGGKIRLWGRDGKLEKTFAAHDAIIYRIAFSNDGKTIASASGDSTIKLWDLDGNLLRTLNGHRGRVWSVVFSSDGDTLVSSSVDGTIKLWHKDGRSLKTIEAHDTVVFDVAISPDGEMLASASDDKTVKLWHKDGRLLETLTGHTETIRRVAFSPDGTTLASASSDRTVKLWSRSGQLLKTFTGHQDKVWGVIYTPDGNSLISSATDKTIRFWKPFQRFFVSLNDHSNRVCGVAFSPDSEIVATASSDMTIKLWDRDGNLLRTLAGHNGRVCAIAFSHDGQFIVTGSDDRTIRIWSVEGKLLKTINSGHREGIWRIALSKDSKTIVTASWDGTIELWSREGELLKVLSNHSDSVVGLAFSPDGEIFASASRDATVKLWSRKGELLQTLKGHRASVWGVVFSPDGETIASASDDRTIRLRSRKGKLLNTLENNDNAFFGVAFSPDGNMLATISNDKTVKLWHKDGRLLNTLFGHATTINAVAWSPDGKQLASVSQKQGIIWDVDKILRVDTFAFACDWVGDYLRNSAEVEESDRSLCN